MKCDVIGERSDLLKTSFITETFSSENLIILSMGLPLPLFSMWSTRRFEAALDPSGDGVATDLQSPTTPDVTA